MSVDLKDNRAALASIKGGFLAYITSAETFLDNRIVTCNDAGTAKIKSYTYQEKISRGSKKSVSTEFKPQTL